MNEKQLKLLVKTLTGIINELEDENDLLRNAHKYRMELLERERNTTKMSKVKYYINKKTKEFYYEEEAREKILKKIGICIQAQGKDGKLTAIQEKCINGLIDTYLKNFDIQWEELE